MWPDTAVTGPLSTLGLGLRILLACRILHDDGPSHGTPNKMGASGSLGGTPTLLVLSTEERNCIPI